ncbi:MAG: hypothetical protein ACRDGM_20045 [bacterium]
MSKTRFLNQKLGKRISRRVEQIKAKTLTVHPPGRRPLVRRPGSS